LSITSADIAKLAGVSRPAVSAVLNGHFNKVSLEKREKILAIARDLQYRPNRAALVLAKKNTHHIGIVSSPFISPIYSSMFSHISMRLAEAGYSCSVVLPGSKAEETAALRNLESTGADGVIGAYFFNDIHALTESFSMPILSMSPYPGQYELRVDLRQALRLSVRHLREHGHKNIALLTPGKSVTPLQVEGYLEAVGAGPSYFLEATANPAFGENLRKLLRNSKVTAFAATNDLLAARFRRYLHERGILVPGDAAVIGFDGNAFDETFLSPLTSVVFPACRLAERAVALLLEKIEKRSHEFIDVPEMIPTELYIGESCGCHPRKSEEFAWSGQPLILE